MTTQKQAIEMVNGPCLVKGGAGSGKTYTIKKKVAHLINTNTCKPSEILCLTFSNEATNHLKSEIEKELKKSSDVTIKTFHSFCASVLREIGHLMKVSPDFTVLLPDDAKVIFHRDLGVTPYYSDKYTKSISIAKDFGISVEQIEKYLNDFKERFFKNIADLDAYANDLDTYANDLDTELKLMHLQPQDTKEQMQEFRERKKFISQFLNDYDYFVRYMDFIDAWKKYDVLKTQKNYLDYSDLNFLVLKIFDSYDADDIANKYKYIIVDEFQDTNKIQFDLIVYLAQHHRNITVVGDPNQSIYGFRGSFRESFTEFMKAFGVKDDHVFTLDKSRRSPNTVLRSSYELIKNNYENPDDCMLIKNYEGIEGSKVKIIELKNGAEESRKVAEIVEKEIEEGTPLKEICVLFRTHNQGKLIQKSLDSKNIPTISAGRTDLLQRPEIRTVIAYLSILNNLSNRTGTGEQSWWELFQYHNALTPEDAVKIGRYLRAHRKEDLSIDYAAILKVDDLDISDHGKEIIRRIKSKLEELMNKSNKPLPELVLDIYELTGLNRFFTHSRDASNVEGLLNLKYFYDVTENFYTMYGKDLETFIDYLEILEKVGVEIEASKITDVDAVRLMTMHAVKGLEFEKVIVTNLSENRFPITRTENEPLIPKELNPDIKIYLDSHDIDSEDSEAIKEYMKKTLLLEERRLCYVAFTRAKDELIVTYARSYNAEEDSTTASDFLKEINYKENPDVEYVIDNDELCTIFAPNSRFEQYKSILKRQLIESLDTDDIEVLLSRLLTYHAVREGEIPKYDINLNKLIDKKELEIHINSNQKKKSSLIFDRANFTFSPTALLTYDDCPKKYELANIFQMPRRGAFEWSGADTGSFVHSLFQIGVAGMFANKEQYVNKALEMSKEEEWRGVDLEDVQKFIDVFWARHAGRYNEKTLVEQGLNIELEGFKFYGIADRIDFINDKDVEIIDYKTQKGQIEPKSRAWQLGFYAIAVKKKYGYNVKKLTLEMLRLEKPLEAEVDGDEVSAGRSRGFKISEVQKELVETAKAIVHDYETEFLPAKDDNSCRYCGYKFYCPKWEEK